MPTFTDAKRERVREYGLPGVVSVAEATQRIETGDHIRVDGDRGTVERLDRSEQSAAVEKSNNA